ncbi:hypothetical protein EZV62_024920 [Acer yangbiense]|uniref:Zinc knuckle CX2CX4HX4C domain-containing protein n=1 Tax=Acer yangbiense TaxID=1000413 RepID=A0A5C7GX44_9ROSI|nr:hypothetical protein EZV62_024920 [Acer yangbiense]
MRVKVRLDISKSLKRWLRLKLGKSDEVTKVNLKYERLPEFCFASGKVGHGIKECLDEEARKTGFDGFPNKFGSWLNASLPDRVKPRFGSQTFESSLKRSRSLEALREIEGDGSVS